MNNRATPFRTVAVLGAGVMGAQIAAHFANAGLRVFLYDLPSTTGQVNALIEASVKGLQKLKPPPLFSRCVLDRIECANYENDLALLSGCDLVVEAISERFEWKEDLYQKIAPHLQPDALLVSNTSGLSINALSELLPAELRPRFFGVHFFNPPRYMALVELIPSRDTHSEYLEALEQFLMVHLGKKIVHAKDTPNFVANRIGVFSLLLTLHHAETYSIPLDVVDALTGTLLGRPKSATLRTLDVVGLDTFANVVNTMTDGLPDDPWRELFTLPDWIGQLIERGSLGQKRGVGIYKKEGRTIQVYQPDQNSYRPSSGKADKGILEILKEKDLHVRFAKLRESHHPQAKFLWACFRDLFHYAAYHLPDIAATVRDVDQALRWGFGWRQGPFETWQLAGWQEIVDAIEHDLATGQTYAAADLPSWLKAPAMAPYRADGAYNPTSDTWEGSRALPAYQRQQYPEPNLAEEYNWGETLYETDSVRLWHTGDEIGILSFKTKLGVISSDVISGVEAALKEATVACKGLVLWQGHAPHFSAGANLQQFVGTIKAGELDALDATLDSFQQMCLALRYAPIPVVAAVRGYAFGGGCEVMLHCDRTVAAAESYVGLVEVGVGLLPAGGGCKEMAQRASAARLSEQPMQHVATYFKNIAMGTTSSSALDAFDLGYLREQDTRIMHVDELLYVAKQQINTMLANGYLPPSPPKIKVCGADGIAQLQMQLVNMREGGMISGHDYQIALTIAEVICGGYIDKDSVVDEGWLLRLEREGFVKLAQTPATIERIEHMLKTGKPLRN